MPASLIDYPIQPEHIDTSKHWYGVFGKLEKDTSARLLVRYAQEELKGWYEIDKDKLNSWIKEDFLFNGLSVPDYNIPAMISPLVGTNSYAFTHAFISRCFVAAPIQKFKISA